MMTLACYNLGEPGLAYMRERLAGGKTLARLLLEGIDLRQGTAWAYLPAGLPESAVLRIDEGIWGKYREIAGDEGAPRSGDIRPSAVLNRIVLRFLRAYPAGIAVHEDFLSSASDPGIRHQPPEAPPRLPGRGGLRRRARGDRDAADAESRPGDPRCVVRRTGGAGGAARVGLAPVRVAGGDDRARGAAAAG